MGVDVDDSDDPLSIAPCNHDLWVIAPEPSALALARPLIAELLARKPRLCVGFVGDGQRVPDRVDLLEDSGGLGIHGIVDVFRSGIALIRKRNRLWRRLIRYPPKVLINIDAIDLGHRLFDLVPSTVRKVQIVPPMVWVWGKHRIRWYQDTDLLMTLFPFEMDPFEGIPRRLVCVGHPLLHPRKERFSRPEFSADKPLIVGLYAGSRRGEVLRHLPILAEVWKWLGLEIKARYPDIPIRHVLPTIPRFTDVIRERWPVLTHGAGSPWDVIDDPDQVADAMKGYTIAAAASGTVTLELSLAGVPHVMFGTADPLMRLAAWLVRADVSRLHLVNRGAEETIVPEFMFGAVDPARMAKHLADCIGEAGDQQRERLRTGLEALRIPVDCKERIHDSAARRMAQEILALL